MTKARTGFVVTALVLAVALTGCVANGGTTRAGAARTTTPTATAPATPKAAKAPVPAVLSPGHRRPRG